MERMKSGLLNLAREVLKVEEMGLRMVRRALGGEFLSAVRLMRSIKGRVIVIGVGKSGLIGRKLASTLTSTGTAAIFMHPAEALHGDLGLVSREDAVLALSFSGETDEMQRLLPHLMALGVPVVSMTGSARSRLAAASTAVLTVPVTREACPYNVTPTASTTAMLALGDALAIVLMKAKGFGRDDFARLHPAGSLGRRLNRTAADIMRRGAVNPVIGQDRPMREALVVMTRAQSGAVSVVDKKGKLAGFFTDGDLRRRLNGDSLEFLKRPVREAMTPKPFAVGPGVLVEDLRRIFLERAFDNIPVIDQRGFPVGLVDERDLL